MSKVGSAGMLSLSASTTFLELTSVLSLLAVTRISNGNLGRARRLRAARARASVTSGKLLLSPLSEVGAEMRAQRCERLACCCAALVNARAAQRIFDALGLHRWHLGSASRASNVNRNRCSSCSMRVSFGFHEAVNLADPNLADPIALSLPSLCNGEVVPLTAAAAMR